MEIIPVIDIKGGVVVRARHGERASYRPIETPLAASSEALDVVAGLLSLHPFRTLYIADLDAIEGRGDALGGIARIAARFPDLRLWVDNGCGRIGEARALLAALPSVNLVLGSESQADAGLVGALRDERRIVLSLDFRGEHFVGPAELLDNAALWPARLIVMTLARVGSGAGPDFSRFRDIAGRAGKHRVYLAGGMRGREDFPAIAASGAAGILVASALHDGRLGSADIAAAENLHASS
jgi:phosphoribosylformimino-5-aminoimidazole carboxamide ribotide isomerase